MEIALIIIIMIDSVLVLLELDSWAEPWDSSATQAVWSQLVTAVLPCEGLGTIHSTGTRLTWLFGHSCPTLCSRDSEPFTGTRLTCVQAFQLWRWVQLVLDRLCPDCHVHSCPVYQGAIQEPGKPMATCNSSIPAKLC
jgi:hypothetical protein